MTMRYAWTVTIVALTMAVGVQPSAQSGERGRATTPAARGGTQAAPAPVPAKPSPGAGPIIVFETVKGTFEMETYPNEAPKSVDHILKLVKRNFYNGLRVHRVVPGQLVQFGDPLSRDVSKRDSWGTGSSGSPIGVSETSPKRRHVLGAVALAHPGDPRRADSQVYVMLMPQPRYDGHYVVIGKVLTGMDVVQKLSELDVIRRATVKEPAKGTE
jgi:peptidyl-prolyl cis-trans isomerase B (cyclophilin B)